MKPRYTTNQAWQRRTWLLRKLEGWYTTKYGSFKLSCRFKDILRSGKWNGHKQNFISCFAADSAYPEQRHKRCRNSRWALVYVPDKHGNYIGRAWIEQRGLRTIVVYPVYGNKLDYFDIEDAIRKRHGWKTWPLKIRRSLSDRYL